MFYSRDILLSRKYGLGTVWYVILKNVNNILI